MNRQEAVIVSYYAKQIRERLQTFKLFDQPIDMNNPDQVLYGAWLLFELLNYKPSPYRPHHSPREEQES